MQTFRILILEEETKIVNRLIVHLRQWGYEIAGVASSLQQARKLYLTHHPDLTFIDLAQGEPEQGVALAHFIQKQKKNSPFIYLTSGPDRREIELIKDTLPAGFVSKPIQPSLLQASVAIALYQQHRQQPSGPVITINQRDHKTEIPIKKILYLEADHVYVQLHTAEGKSLLQRRSLTDLLEQLPAEDFLQTHRSFAVNVKQLSHWDSKYVYVGDQAVPVSRYRKKEVLAFLSTLQNQPSRQAGHPLGSGLV